MFSLRIFAVFLEKKNVSETWNREEAVRRNMGKTACEGWGKIQHFCGRAGESVPQASDSASGKRL